MQLLKAARRFPPNGVLTPQAITTSSTSAVDISSLANQYIAMQAITANVVVVFGGASIGAAVLSTPNGLYISAGKIEEFLLPSWATHYRAIGSASGHLLVWASSD